MTGNNYIHCIKSDSKGNFPAVTINCCQCLHIENRAFTFTGPVIPSSWTQETLTTETRVFIININNCFMCMLKETLIAENSGVL